jgi:holo-ACP synthase CitX
MHRGIFMEEVSLQEMLAAREHRVALQIRLLQQYKKSLISFTLNIPGPVKVPDGVPQAFATGCRRIEALLKDRLVLVQHMETIKEKTGYEAFYCIDANPEFIKTLMVTLEDQDRLGRLFDIDVIRPDGSKVSREELGRPPRTCCVKNLPMPAAAAAGTAWQSSRPKSAIS